MISVNKRFGRFLLQYVHEYVAFSQVPPLVKRVVRCPQRCKVPPFLTLTTTRGLFGLRGMLKRGRGHGSDIDITLQSDMDLRFHRRLPVELSYLRPCFR